MAYDFSSMTYWQARYIELCGQKSNLEQEISNLTLSESAQNSSIQQCQQRLQQLNNEIATAQQQKNSLQTLEQSQTEHEKIKKELDEKNQFFDYLNGLLKQYQKVEGIQVEPALIAVNKISSNELIHTDLLDIISKKQCKEAFDVALSKIKDINCQDNEGKTILMHSLINGFYYGVDLLLNKNADVNILDSNGANALFYCSKMPHVKYFKMIAEKIDNINYRVPSIQNGSYLQALIENSRSIIYASELNNEFKGYDHTMNGKSFVVDEDFTMNFSIGSERADGYTMNQEKTLFLIDFLVKKGADINLQNDNGLTPLYISFAHKLKYLSRKLIDNYELKWNLIDKFGFNILQWVLELNDKDIFEKIISKGIDINHQDNKGKTTLFWAVSYKSVDIVNLLFNKYKALDLPTKSGLTAWDVATYNCDENIIDIILTEDVQKQHIDLWCASKKGDLSKVEELLKNGVSPNVTINNIKNTTPLIQAVMHIHTEVIKLLLNYKADINKTDKDGASPLYYSLGYGDQPLVSTDIINLLISNGANVNQTTHNGNTPLHMACFKGNANAIKILIRNKCKKDAKNNQNKTPMDILDDKSGFHLDHNLIEFKLLFED